MTKYDHYTDSSIDWLGDIPSHWEVLPVKYVADLFTGNSLNDIQKEFYSNINEGYEYISTKDISIHPQIINYNTDMKIPYSEVMFKVAPKDSTLVCIEGGSAGKKIAYNNRDITFVNKLCCIKGYDSAYNKFIYYYCNSRVFTKVFLSYISGLIGGVSTTILKNFQFILPPLEEQEIIAQYLDTKTQKIDSLISDKEKMIILLKEQRSAIISETVTKGLNPNTAFKDSGVKWLGDIPTHWEVKKIKYVAEINMGSSPKSEYYSDDSSHTLFIQGNADIKNKKIIPRMYTTQITKMCEIGDILLSVRAPVGTVLIANYQACIGRGFCAIKGNKYLHYFLEMLNSSNFWDKLSFGTTFEAITVSNIQQILISLPPLEEQEIIAHYLDTKTQKIDSLISDIQQNISLLKEYRQSLISETVTGKRRVTHGL